MAMLLRPVWLLYVPTGHAWHRDALVKFATLDQVPWLQAVQEADASVEYHPGMHPLQYDTESAATVLDAVPAGQPVHVFALLAPTTDEYVPAWHFWHAAELLAPCLSEKVPASQGLHASG